MRRLLRAVRKGFGSRSAQTPPPTLPVEPLETRTMFAISPATVATAYFDNRGTASLTFSKALDPATLSNRSAKILSPGPDAKLGTGDDVALATTVRYKKGVLTLSAGVKKNKAYRVLLDAARIKDVNGKFLDGEFNGQGKASGNGRAGGNFDVLTKAPSAVAYRFTVVTGATTRYINVKMFADTPVTVANFRSYADAAAWDTTFFHRSTRDATSGIQVIQGGGFNLDSQGQIGSVTANAGVGLELKHSNLRGTIAMARQGGNNNSNTNQWFFNVNDNAGLDSIGGGYTAFGQVMDAASQRALEAVNALAIRQGDPNNEFSPFNELPSLDPTGQIDVPADLVRIARVAMLMDVVKRP